MLGLSTDDVVVFAAARQAYQKGVDVLVEAFPRILDSSPRARLVLAGREGDMTARIRERVAGLGLQAVSIQLGIRTDVPDIMTAADVFVLPSRWEGLGSVLVEAMALEAPIVASDLPAVREVLTHDDTALLLPPERPDLLAEAVSAAIADAERSADRARRARERFLSNYTMASISRQTIAFYERAVGVDNHEALASVTN
jgi:glycosyltransferase involved in cell wall biosynthesis